MTFCRFAAAIALCSLGFTATTPVEAGQKQTVSDASISSITLLSLENVQAELRLSDEQKAKFAHVRKKLQSGLQSTMMGDEDGGYALPAGGASQGIEEETAEATIADQRYQDPATRMLKGMEKLEADAKTVLDTLLSEEQRERLKQINLQARGAGALSDPEVTQQLRLTREQQQKLAEIRQATTLRRTKLFQNAKKTTSRERAQSLQRLRRKRCG